MHKLFLRRIPANCYWLTMRRWVNTPSPSHHLPGRTLRHGVGHVEEPGKRDCLTYTHTHSCTHFIVIIFAWWSVCLSCRVWGNVVAWAMCWRREHGAPRLSPSVSTTHLSQFPHHHCVPLVSYSPVPSCPSVIWENQCEAMCHATLWNDWK